MKLRAIDIPKEALKIFSKNSNLIIFAALISLPLFLFSLYFENRFQSFILQVSQFLQESKNESKDPFRTLELEDSFFMRVYERPKLDLLSPLNLVRKLSNDLFQEFGQLGFLYLVPFNLIQLVSLIFVVDVASKLYREDQRALTLKDMFGVRFGRERLQGIFVTFLCVVLLSIFTITGFIWLAITYSYVLVRLSNSSYYNVWYNYYSFSDIDFSIHAIYGSNFVFLSGIYLCWSGIWNLGLVVSILEGKYVVKALGSSSYLCLRNLQNGMVLMLVFSLWEMGLRLWGFGVVFSSFWLEKRWVFVVAQSGLFCFGSALKWVCFVVYFEDCVRRLFRKKIDVGGEESL